MGNGSSLVAAVDGYLSHIAARGLAQHTQSGYSYALRAVLLPWCEEHGIGSTEELSQATWDALATDLLETPGRRKGTRLSRVTVAGYLRVVAHLTAWLAAEGEAVGRPHIPTTRRAQVEVLTRSELQRLEDACAVERDKLLVRLMGDCGVRVGEIVKLRPSDIVERDRERYLYVRGKGQRDRWVPLPRWWRRLQVYATRGRPQPATEALFLTLRRQPSGLYEGITESGIQQLVAWATKGAGLGKRVYPHLLRHSAITHMLKAGMNQFQVSAIVGNYSHLQLYAHVTASDARSSFLSALE